jgi:hypothetical protein
MNPKTNPPTCPIPVSGPPAFHTYQGTIFAPQTGELFVFGTVGYCDPNAYTGPETDQGWVYNPLGKTWSAYNNLDEISRFARTDSLPSGNILVFQRNELAEVDPVTKGIVRRSGTYGDYGDGAGVLHPNGQWYFTSGTNLYETQAVPTFGGEPSVVASASPLPGNMGRRGGIALHTPSGLLVFWDGGQTVSTWDPATGETTVTTPTTGPLVNGSGGVYSKWIYLKDLDVFAGYNNVDEGLWLYKLPTSQGGTGSVSCSNFSGPCVTLAESGGDFTELKPAIDAVRPCGTVVVEPGVYAGSWSFISNRSCLTVIGSDPVNRPVLTAWSQAALNNPANAMSSDRTASIFGYGGSNSGTFRLENLELTGAGADCVWAGSPSYQQTIILENVYIHHCSAHNVMVGFETGGSGPIDDQVFIANSEFSHVGLNHNVYIDRIRFARVESSKFTSPSCGHTLKVVAQEQRIIGNELSNVEMDGTHSPPSADPLEALTKSCKPRPEYHGESPLSTVACSWGEFTNNRVVFLSDSAYSPQVLHWQPRHDIQGCDMPPYSSPEFTDPAFWANIVAQGLGDDNDPLDGTAAANPGLFNWYISGNDFTMFGPVLSGQYPYVYRNSTTFPGDFQGVPLVTPPEWEMRLVLHIANNTYSGGFPNRYWRTDGFRGYDLVGVNGSGIRAEPTGTATPVVGGRIHVVGGEDGTSITLPPWFQTGVP